MLLALGVGVVTVSDPNSPLLNFAWNVVLIGT